MADPVRHDETPWEDPRLATRRQKVKLAALRLEMAARPVEAPGRLRTILDEFRWRQLQRSLSGGMTAAGWVFALLFLCAAFLGIVVLIKIL
jgi:hypothetical protein